MRPLGFESLTGIVAVRINSSTAMLHAVARGADVGPNVRSRWAQPLGACDLGVTYHLDLRLTYHPDLKRSEQHMVMVVVDWPKRIFRVALPALAMSSSIPKA